MKMVRRLHELFPRIQIPGEVEDVGAVGAQCEQETVIQDRDVPERAVFRKLLQRQKRRTVVHRHHADVGVERNDFVGALRAGFVTGEVLNIMCSLYWIFGLLQLKLLEVVGCFFIPFADNRVVNSCRAGPSSAASGGDLEWELLHCCCCTSVRVLHPFFILLGDEVDVMNAICLPQEAAGFRPARERSWPEEPSAGIANRVRAEKCRPKQLVADD
eukprot:g163.t1